MRQYSEKLCRPRQQVALQRYIARVFVSPQPDGCASEAALGGRKRVSGHQVVGVGPSGQRAHPAEPRRDVRPVGSGIEPDDRQAIGRKGAQAAPGALEPLHLHVHTAFEAGVGFYPNGNFVHGDFDKGLGLNRNWNGA